MGKRLHVIERFDFFDKASRYSFSKKKLMNQAIFIDSFIFVHFIVCWSKTFCSSAQGLQMVDPSITFAIITEKRVSSRKVMPLSSRKREYNYLQRFQPVNCVRASHMIIMHFKLTDFQSNR